jgi:hypothetical protein
MDTKTGRIESIYTEEDERDALERGLRATQESIFNVARAADRVCQVGRLQNGTRGVGDSASLDARRQGALAAQASAPQQGAEPMSEEFTGWAIVEVMGHKRVAGLCDSGYEPEAGDPDDWDDDGECDTEPPQALATERASVKIDRTGRGFFRAEFEDCFGQRCSLQKSSLATEDAIWLGIDNTGPHLTHPDDCEKPPSEARFNADVYMRMHLTRDQVAELLPLLQRFVDTGGGVPILR